MWHDAGAATAGFGRGLAQAAHPAPHAPTLAIVAGILLAVLVPVFSLAVALVSNRQPPGRDGDDDQGSGPGGGPGRPGPDDGDAPGGAPAWWPDFEREFAAYAANRNAVNQPTIPRITVPYDCQMTPNDCQVQVMRVMPGRRSVMTSFATTGGQSMFSTDHITQVLAARDRAQALDVWRDAANLVSTRWQLFVEAEPEVRQWAFASYVAALNAEEAAAAEMAKLAPPMAA
jgi:hypothetical protein